MVTPEGGFLLIMLSPFYIRGRILISPETCLLRRLGDKDCNFLSCFSALPHFCLCVNMDTVVSSFHLPLVESSKLSEFPFKFAICLRILIFIIFPQNTWFPLPPFSGLDATFKLRPEFCHYKNQTESDRNRALETLLISLLLFCAPSGEQILLVGYKLLYKWRQLCSFCQGRAGWSTRSCRFRNAG